MIGIFAALMAVCSWISIPAAVPFTMQTFGIFLAVGMLGGKRGSLSVCIYLLLGAAGLPVFSGFAGGLGYMMGATGGYIIGFLFSALVMWGFERLSGNSWKALFVSMLLGLSVCYAFGTAWFIYVYTGHNGPISITAALGMCVIPYIIPDIIKAGLALMLCKRLKPMLGSITGSN